ncbi:hypothetical protein [Pandoraea captiosa]|uniref:hypothetical protein n=1 Tax=Pandoraea captiosa TaxID=2508302 RepID=UPI00123EF587|nr:hypothetical protein [Pandoraea captiosa]
MLADGAPALSSLSAMSDAPSIAGGASSFQRPGRTIGAGGGAASGRGGVAALPKWFPHALRGPMPRA